MPWLMFGLGRLLADLCCLYLDILNHVEEQYQIIAYNCPVANFFSDPRVWSPFGDPRVTRVTCQKQVQTFTMSGFRLGRGYVERCFIWFDRVHLDGDSHTVRRNVKVMIQPGWYDSNIFKPWINLLKRFIFLEGVWYERNDPDGNRFWLQSCASFRPELTTPLLFQHDLMCLWFSNFQFGREVVKCNTMIPTSSYTIASLVWEVSGGWSKEELMETWTFEWSVWMIDSALSFRCKMTLLDVRSRVYIRVM